MQICIIAAGIYVLLERLLSMYVRKQGKFLFITQTRSVSRGIKDNSRKPSGFPGIKAEVATIWLKTENLNIKGD